jgi:hypothetical protein
VGFGWTLAWSCWIGEAATIGLSNPGGCELDRITKKLHMDIFYGFKLTSGIVTMNLAQKEV